jgi:hypothetical protein
MRTTMQMESIPHLNVTVTELARPVDFYTTRRKIMQTKFFPTWLRLAAAFLILLSTFAASPAQANEPAIDGIIGAGSQHTCALKPDGSVDCWGSNTYGQAEDQPGPYTQLSVGYFHNCALTPSGASDCWGADNFGADEDQPGPYIQISAGLTHTCAITPSGAVDCWGYNSYGQVEDRPGPYLQVSAGNGYTCVLTTSGAVECWGANEYGQVQDLPGPYTQIYAATSNTCALTPSGAVDCWGNNYYGQAEDLPGPYIQLSTGMHYTCGLTPSGAVDCWGANIYGQIEDRPGPYIQVSASISHTCALTTSGAVECWGTNNYGEAVDQPGPYGAYQPVGDTTPPVVTVTGVTEGSTYILGAVPQAGCSTTDEGSGVAVEAGLSLSGGNALGVGSFTATCSGALDNAGNPGNTAVVHYDVTYLFTGFISPVNNPPEINIAKAGQTIPLKWRITDANGSPVMDLTDVTVAASGLSCDTGTTGDQIEEYATGSTGLQNLGDGYYQWNWKTPKSFTNSCKTLRLDLGESAGSEHIALFRFK